MRRPIAGALDRITDEVIEMRRRDLVKTTTGVALAWPQGAGAQRSDTRKVRIGIIDNGPIWDDFRKGLRDLGYVESAGRGALLLVIGWVGTLAMLGTPPVIPVFGATLAEPLRELKA